MADTYLNSLLAQNEKILYITRRHWLVLMAEILTESVLTIALIVLVTVILVMFPAVGLFVALGYLLLLLPLASLTRDTLDWYNRKYVVTTRRIIHLEGLFNKDVTDSSLEKVNDVKLEQSLWGRMLNYGTVEILTASELGVNKFKIIADPIGFKTAMLNAKHRLESNGEDLHAARRPPAATDQPERASLLEQVQSQRPAAAPAPPPAPANVPELLRQLDELRQAGVLTEAEFQNKKGQLLARL